MDDVIRQVQQTHKVLEQPDAEWSAVSSTLGELADSIEALSSQQPMRDVSRQLLTIANELGAQVVGYRSKLVGEVCAHITRIVHVMKRDFREVANELLPSLANTAKGASGAVRQPGAKLFSVVSEHVRYDLQFFKRIFVQSPQEKVRVLMLEQIALILTCWRKEEIEPYYSDVLDIIQRGLLDSPQQVRSASRDVFCSFAAQWEERVHELVDVPSAPARDLLLREKPHAAISLAIVEKYPELQKKISRADSSKTIAKQRSLYRKSPSMETQPVEIHVATPPEKKRLDQPIKDDARPRPSFQRQLFQESDNEVPRPRKSGIRPPSTSKVDQTQSESHRFAPQPNPTGIPVPPALTRPDDAFRRSRIEVRAEGSKIPPPTTKSPATRDKSIARPAVVSRSHDTASFESGKPPSFIPKPSGRISFSMDSFKHGLNFENSVLADTGQGNQPPASNPRDDFLDNPIPSSATPPTPRSDTNVTVRARRQGPKSDERGVAADDAIPVPPNGRDTRPPQEEDPLPPTISLDSEVLKQETSQQAIDNMEQFPFAAAQENVVVNSENKTAAGILNQESVFDAAVVISSDADGEETMLINRDSARHDYVEEVTGIRGRVEIGSEAPIDTLPKDALENLKGIQEKMATLRMLTKVDARGIPFKPPVSKITEPSSPRPLVPDQTFSTAEIKQTDQIRAADEIQTKVNAQNGKVADENEFSYQIRDSNIHRTLDGDGKELKRDFVKDHQSRKMTVEAQRVNKTVHGNPPRGRGHIGSLQTEYPSHRPRAVNQPITDADRDEVERHFNEIVREGLVSDSRPSSAERKATASERPRDSVKPPIQDPSRFKAHSDHGSEAPPSMEPPLQWTVKPAEAVSQRRSPVQNPDTNSRVDVATRDVGFNSGHRVDHETRACSPGRNHADVEPVTKDSWTFSFVVYFCLVLGFIFGASGLLRAATTMRDSHEYHQALLTRIGKFESSISESYVAVRKLEENYAVWSEYVRVLAEEDETHALSLLETIQHEVEKWQVEMKEDLTQFKKSLSVDVVEAALAPLLRNATEERDG